MTRALESYRSIKDGFAKDIFKLARLSNWPVIGRLINWYLFRGNKLYFLPQDQVIKIDQSIDAPENLVLPSQIVEHFIKKSKHHWIMNHCVCRDGNQCEDYPIDLGCIFLGEAAMQIHPELGRRVDAEEALEHLNRCREAGLIQMIGRDRLDSVVLGVGPGDKLMTICNCCQCCCLWRIIPLAADRITSKVVSMPGVSVRVNEKCDGCGLCTEAVCFVEAVNLVGEQAEINKDCRGCGRCVTVCPSEAIDIIFDEPDFTTETIRDLSNLVELG
jgi:ferredoxin